MSCPNNNNNSNNNVTRRKEELVVHAKPYIISFVHKRLVEIVDEMTTGNHTYTTAECKLARSSRSVPIANILML